VTALVLDAHPKHECPRLFVGPQVQFPRVLRVSLVKHHPHPTLGFLVPPNQSKLAVKSRSVELQGLDELAVLQTTLQYQSPYDVEKEVVTSSRSKPVARDLC
jgi:hypothetical protein